MLNLKRHFYAIYMQMAIFNPPLFPFSSPLPEIRSPQILWKSEKGNLTTVESEGERGEPTIPQQLQEKIGNYRLQKVNE